MKEQTPTGKNTDKILKVPTRAIVAQTPTTIYTQLMKFQNLGIILPKKETGVAADGKKYKYVTLDDLLNTVTKPLLDLNVGLTQVINAGQLTTALFHVNGSGERSEITSTINIGQPTSNQDFGTRITYMRRYALAPMLGISSEEDTDAGNAVEQKTTASVDERIKDTELPKVNIAPSENFLKATAMIAAAMTSPAINVLRAAIEKSTKLEDSEKAQLITLANTRESELGK